ncbi:MAG: hypothetical protein MUC29_04560 [Pyrinomonadaceae bacterium]|jgi:hypothetical protein|nr:hypothetical protein [Pyrinomonadaceae bacterium]
MQRDKIKTAFAAILSLYFFSIIYNPFTGSFLDFIDLPIHETGHLLFRPFGEFMMVAGGTLFQVFFRLFLLDILFGTKNIIRLQLFCFGLGKVSSTSLFMQMMQLLCN